MPQQIYENGSWIDDRVRGPLHSADSATGSENRKCSPFAGISAGSTAPEAAAFARQTLSIVAGMPYNWLKVRPDDRFHAAHLL
jgi:hypothetical protein